MVSDLIRAAVDSALVGGCFFVAVPGRLRIAHVEHQRVPWEIFRGHLLDPAHAREHVEFEAWNIFLDRDRAPATTPLVSIKRPRGQDRLYVTRQILTRGFEAYEDTAGVILSRGVEKWVMELVGTIDVENFQAGPLAAELGRYLFLAVVGTSRLPITSLESPLPAFSLGLLAYVPKLSEAAAPCSDAIAFLRSALRGERRTIDEAKALETALRAAPADQLSAIAHALIEGAHRRSSEPDFIPTLFREVFNHVALSPYTEFADRLIAVLWQLSATEHLSRAAASDVLGYMLRQLCRHLTAFDLTLFHNLGANYPDALFLDSLLTAYLRSIEEEPDCFSKASADSPSVADQKRRRRRALRQACLARKQYEGHRVPDAPTSMGENARVLPAGFAQVPEEQIFHTAARSRKLFDGRPLETLLGEAGRRALDESVADLDQPLELRELGMAHFLDRPLGIFKQPGEVDRTPLLAYQAFSHSIVKKRLSQLKSWGWISQDGREQYVAAAANLSVPGVRQAAISAVERPGVVSLADAQKVAADFVFLRTTFRSLDALLAHYDLQPLARASSQIAQWLKQADSKLLVQDAPPEESRATLKLYDDKAALRLELGFAGGGDRMARYRERGGVELVERLQVLRIGDVHDNGAETLRDVGDQSLWLELKD